MGSSFNNMASVLSADLDTHYQSNKDMLTFCCFRCLVEAVVPLLDFLIRVSLKGLSWVTTVVCEINMRDWVRFPEYSVFACTLCHVVLFSASRPELFSGTRTHSSDRTMDMGLAEDHFSRPMASKALLLLSALCEITFFCAHCVESFVIVHPV